MRILILEDDENRIVKFRENFIGCELYITKDPNLANEWITKHSFDWIFLDHDLEDWHYEKDCTSNETTGLCTAEFLGNNPDYSKGATVVVHSLNWNGRVRMMQALGDRPAYQLPFTNLFDRLVIDL